MYSRFLLEAGLNAEAALAADAAGRWSELAAALRAASESDEAVDVEWEGIAAGAALVLAAEESLWPALLDAVS
jgi:hypothetical protein